MPVVERPSAAAECAACGIAMIGAGKIVHCADCLQDHVVCDACATEVVSPEDGYEIAV